MKRANSTNNDLPSSKRQRVAVTTNAAIEEWLDGIVDGEGAWTEEGISGEFFDLGRDASDVDVKTEQLIWCLRHVGTFSDRRHVPSSAVISHTLDTDSIEWAVDYLGQVVDADILAMKEGRPAASPVRRARNRFAYRLGVEAMLNMYLDLATSQFIMIKHLCMLHDKHRNSGEDPEFHFNNWFWPRIIEKAMGPENHDVHERQALRLVTQLQTAHGRYRNRGWMPGYYRKDLARIFFGRLTGINMDALFVHARNTILEARFTQPLSTQPLPVAKESRPQSQHHLNQHWISTSRWITDIEYINIHFFLARMSDRRSWPGINSIGLQTIQRAMEERPTMPWQADSNSSSDEDHHPATAAAAAAAAGTVVGTRRSLPAHPDLSHLELSASIAWLAIVSDRLFQALQNRHNNVPYTERTYPPYMPGADGWWLHPTTGEPFTPRHWLYLAGRFTALGLAAPAAAMNASYLALREP